MWPKRTPPDLMYLLLNILQTLYGSRAAQHVDSRPVLAELGLMLACCPPVPFTSPEFRTLGLGLPVRALQTDFVLY